MYINNLSYDLIEYIFTECLSNYKDDLFNLYKTYKYLLLINKNTHNILKIILYQKYYNLKCNYIDKFSFPKNIIKLFQNYNNIYNLPILRFSDNFHGYTDCIDNIKEKDVIDKIMLGFDYFKRPFFTFKLLYFNTKTKKIDSKISILYQRYSNESDYWIFESYYTDNFHDIFKSNDNFIKLNKIMRGEKIKYKNYLVYI
jgi:hypothetical protein